MHFPSLCCSKLQNYKKKVEALIEAGNGASKIPCHHLQYLHSLVKVNINIVFYMQAQFAIILDTQSLMSYFFFFFFSFFFFLLFWFILSIFVQFSEFTYTNEKPLSVLMLFTDCKRYKLLNFLCYVIFLY